MKEITKQEMQNHNDNHKDINGDVYYLGDCHTATEINPNGMLNDTWLLTQKLRHGQEMRLLKRLMELVQMMQRI